MSSNPKKYSPIILFIIILIILIAMLFGYPIIHIRNQINLNSELEVCQIGMELLNDTAKDTLNNEKSNTDMLFWEHKEDIKRCISLKNREFYNYELQILDALSLGIIAVIVVVISIFLLIIYLMLK